MSGFWKPGPASQQILREDDNNHTNDESVCSASAFNFSRAPLVQQRMLLPIYKHKRQILYSIEAYSVIVIVGETGSGKSTQIPQYLYENGWADNDFQIVCTQPRRIAAQTLAQRVSQEVGDTAGVGGTVGYTVRFDDVTSQGVTKIKYVTDGVLVREATMSDPLLSNYSIIMVDEAHERNLNSDVLLGLLKKIRHHRADLRIVICSATIDAEAFLNFFIKQKNSSSTNKESSEERIDNKGAKRSRWDTSTFSDLNHNSCSIIGKDIDQGNQSQGIEVKDKGTIISVDGRQHAVDILYLAQPAPDYIRTTVQTALQIHDEENNGDILCFLPSGEDIDRCIQLAEELMVHIPNRDDQKGIDLLPLYGTLPYHMQARVFQPPDRHCQRSRKSINRRIVFATNIAETSVTVPNIKYVIDSGLSKLPYYDPKTAFDRLIISPISHASARQRAGRSGRVQSGKCYRLYTEAFFFNHMKSTTAPEIMRTNLTPFILTLKALGVDNVLAFDLLDLPSVDALAHGLECLFALKAIDDKTNPTQLGMDMSTFPTEPRVSKMLLQSLELGCSWEVLGVASAMQVRELFVKPRGGRHSSRQQQMIDYEAVMSNLADPSGDHVTHANLIAEQDDSEMDEQECREKFINYQALCRAMEVRNQLKRFLRRFGRIEAMGLVRGGDGTERSKAIRKCVTAGFFFNVAKLANDGRYYAMRKRVLVTPNQSSVFHSHGSSSEYIVFGETYDGARGGIELRSVSTIDARWLRELAPHYWE